MANLTPNQRRRVDRVERLIGIASPFLDVVLAVGDRISRVAQPNDHEYYPARAPSGEEWRRLTDRASSLRDAGEPDAARQPAGEPLAGDPHGDRHAGGGEGTEPAPPRRTEAAEPTPPPRAEDAGTGV